MKPSIRPLTYAYTYAPRVSDCSATFFEWKQMNLYGV
eukprot:COSAG05_NODE_8040_length_742_cov_2.872473_2_plen_36_part_01